VAVEKPHSSINARRQDGLLDRSSRPRVRSRLLAFAEEASWLQSLCDPEDFQRRPSAAVWRFQEWPERTSINGLKGRQPPALTGHCSIRQS